MQQDKPIIGVLACSKPLEGEAAQTVKARYLEGVTSHAGAVALVVPNDQPAANAAAIVARLDALLLTGSTSNIAPARYGSDVRQSGPGDVTRDDMSTALVSAAIAAGKPVFGICRGLQEINVALGGTLVDLGADPAARALHHAADDGGLEAMFAHAHSVSVVAATPLARITGAPQLVVNSVHYQGVGRLAEGLIVNATGPDGLIEAVSGDGLGAPVFAVQWHPEWRPVERPHDLAFWHQIGRVARGERETGD